MKSFNKVEMKGRLYTYALEEKDTDNGDTAITGTITMEVDDKGTTAEARFYATPLYSSGKVNKTYTVLEGILAGNYKTVVEYGEEADWLGMSGNIDVSYFGGRDGAKTADDLVRSQKIRGSFLNQNPKREYTNKWNCDMYITRVQDIEADEERGFDRYVKVIGYIVDDYRKQLNEVVFEARNAAAMNYIMTLPVEGGQPYAVAVWGGILNSMVKSIKKSAFGEDEVQEFETKRWAISGMAQEPYEFGDESVMTESEWKEYMDNLGEAKKKEVEKAASDGAAGNKPNLAF